MSSAIEEIWPKGYEQSELYKVYPDLYRAVFVERRNVLISGPGGCGKCMKKSQPVMLANGTIKLAGDLWVGDQLMGDDSTPRNILGIERGEDDMYEIRTKKNDVYHFTTNHVLTLRSSLPKIYYRKTRLDSPYSVMYYCYPTGKIRTKAFPTEETRKVFFDSLPAKGALIDVPLPTFIKNFSNGRRSTYVDTMLMTRLSVNFPTRQVNLDPYYVGLWLGDGNTANQNMTSADPEIVIYLKGFAASHNCTLNSTGYLHYTLVKPAGLRNPIKTLLHSYNLIGNKHIPPAYLHNSREIRLAVLAGLLDSDGYLNGLCCYEIVQKSKKLADGIVYLARSLGFHATLREVEKTCTNSSRGRVTGIYHQVYISGNGLNEIPVILSRKKASPRKQIKDPRSSTISSIKNLGKQPYIGFELDGNHRFMLGDFTVTHNSHSIGMIKQESLRISIQCDLTSTTGVSAHALGFGASTIHRWSGIKLGDKPYEVIMAYIKKKGDNLKRWKNVEILVIDEVSMLGASILTLINRLGTEIRISRKELKRMTEAKEPIPAFGGIQIIFSADFLQLRPIKDDWSFMSPAWNQLNLFSFRTTHPYRYPDPKHFELLSRFRVGSQTEADLDALRARVVAYEDYRVKERRGELTLDANGRVMIKPTRIYPLKADVEAINLAELEKLEGDTVCYEAEDTIAIKVSKDGDLMIHPKNLNTAEYSEYMDGIVAPEILLKEGAQVMLTKNLSVEEGLVNGARGVVEECHDERVVVRFKCGMVVDIIPHPYEFEDEKVSMVRQQFPLILASSISIHRSQGSTLDYCIMDLGTSLFSPALGYVALSRCKTIEGILIINLMPKMIRCDEEALAFERELIRGSVLAPKLILPEEIIEEPKEIVDDLTIKLADLAVEIESKVGCKHQSGITIVCKLCRVEKVKHRKEPELGEPGE